MDMTYICTVLFSLIAEAKHYILSATPSNIPLWHQQLKSFPPWAEAAVRERAWWGMRVEFSWGWIDSSETQKRVFTHGWVIHQEDGVTQQIMKTRHQINGCWLANPEASSSWLCWGPSTCGAEVEEHGQLPAAGQPCVRLAQLVEEGVWAGLQRREPGGRRVLQQAGAQSDGFWRRARLKHLREREFNHIGLKPAKNQLLFGQFEASI